MTTTPWLACGIQVASEQEMQNSHRSGLYAQPMLQFAHVGFLSRIGLSRLSCCSWRMLDSSQELCSEGCAVLQRAEHCDNEPRIPWISSCIGARGMNSDHYSHALCGLALLLLSLITSLSTRLQKPSALSSKLGTLLSTTVQPQGCSQHHHTAHMKP